MATNKGASPDVSNHNDLDDLFGDNNDPFRPLSAPAKESSGFTSSRNYRSAAGLGIDEEVEIAKKLREPRVKLDETRLLSDAGIKKLRKTAKDKLRFKGKGHEFSDCARLLSFYQLWLDGLFPKANFADALAMVEKLGHKKTIQRMRMDWINEGKQRNSVHEESIFNDPIPEPRQREKSQTASRIAPIFEARQSERTKSPELIEDDIYGVSPQLKRRPTALVKSLFGGASNDTLEDDDLDALFGEDELLEIGTGKATETLADAPKDDDLDALFAEESNTSKPNPTMTHNDFDDDEEAMAEMDMDLPW